MSAWDTWASGVLTKLGAPVNATNVDTLWAWSGAESLPRDRMSWNNPLDTTQPWPGSIDQNPVGVKYYVTVEDGIDATVVTLGNGFYPTILAHLRNSVPRQQWADACAELDTWGTGCGWINNSYGAYSGSLETADLTPDEHAWLDWLRQAFQGAPYSGMPAELTAIKSELDLVKAELDAIKTAVAAIPAGSAEPAEPKKLDGTISVLNGAITGTVTGTLS